MAAFQYKQVNVAWGDLSQINSLGALGWHVVGVFPVHPHNEFRFMALMELPVTGGVPLEGKEEREPGGSE